MFKVEVVMAVDPVVSGSTYMQRNRAKYLEEYNHNDAVEQHSTPASICGWSCVLLDGWESASFYWFDRVV